MVNRLRQGWVTILFQIFIVYNFNIQCTVLAAVNITIDDSDPSIHYAPPGAWGTTNETPLDHGGSHMLTSNSTGTASFNFTGTAIYFMSPLWPYIVNTAISLDHGPSTLVDLLDHSRPMTDGGPETVQSQVVWQATELNNTQHNLLIFIGANQPYAIVDGLIYTTDVTSVDSLSSSTSPTSTTPTSPTSTTSSPTSTTSSPTSTTSSPASTTSSLTPTPKSKDDTIIHPKFPSTLAIIFISLFAASLVSIFGLLWRFFGPRQKKFTLSPRLQRPLWTIEGELWTPVDPHMFPPRPNARTQQWELC